MSRRYGTTGSMGREVTALIAEWEQGQLSRRSVLRRAAALGLTIPALAVLAGRAGTGQLARSLAISTDGLSLYVVNYGSASMTKLRASDMAPLQTVPTGVNPIGVTYDPLTGDVWVAIYGGALMIFDDA